MKKLAARIETYVSKGETKSKYAQIGIIKESQNGEYAMLDPTINLAGILLKQNIMAAEQNKPQRNMIMCSIFVDDGNKQGFKQKTQATQSISNYKDGDSDDGVPF